jgi:hypothetical protein
VRERGGERGREREGEGGRPIDVIDDCVLMGDVSLSEANDTVEERGDELAIRGRHLLLPVHRHHMREREREREENKDGSGVFLFLVCCSLTIVMAVSRLHPPSSTICLVLAILLLPFLCCGDGVDSVECVLGDVMRYRIAQFAIPYTQAKTQTLSYPMPPGYNVCCYAFLSGSYQFNYDELIYGPDVSSSPTYVSAAFDGGLHYNNNPTYNPTPMNCYGLSSITSPKYCVISPKCSLLSGSCFFDLGLVFANVTTTQNGYYFRYSQTPLDVSQFNQTLTIPLELGSYYVYQGPTPYLCS